MCNTACIRFGEKHLLAEEVAGKRILEVGAYDVNGSVRPIVEALGPSIYIGVDMREGPRVDRICLAEDLITTFGMESFDVVICMEVMEHVCDWRKAISNMKNVLKPGGLMVLTTRSKGFVKHDYPSDYWRYETEDMVRIFGDMIDVIIEKDSDPGVFVRARKPMSFIEANLEDMNLYRIE